jgi:hypothetical protein
MGRETRSRILKGLAAWRQENADSTGEENPKAATAGISKEATAANRERGLRTEGSGSVGGRECPRRKKGRSGTGPPKVEYPEAGQRTIRRPKALKLAQRQTGSAGSKRILCSILKAENVEGMKNTKNVKRCR